MPIKVNPAPAANAPCQAGSDSGYVSRTESGVGVNFNAKCTISASGHTLEVPYEGHPTPALNAPCKVGKVSGLISVSGLGAVTNAGANAGPGNLWTDTYFSPSKEAIFTCGNIAKRALAAEHWGNLTYLSNIYEAAAWEGVRGSMRARIICILCDLPPTEAEGFAAILIVHGNVDGVLSTGPELKQRFVSLAPQTRQNY